MERQPLGLERLDSLGKHVADDHLVTEVGEAATGDEPDPARTEDADLPRFHHAGEKPYRGRGASPFAIASIVSFESESRTEFTTQYVAPSLRRTTMCRCGPE